MKIDIPKGFFEDKSSVTPAELLTMVSEFVRKTDEIEERLNYEFESTAKYIYENYELKQRIKELEVEFKRLGLDGAL